MDVYAISDAQSFSDSVASATMSSDLTTPTNQSSTPVPPSEGVGGRGGQGMPTALSTLLLSLALIACIVSTV